jgi:2-polyprenyl-6-hydroxyphenyl methylase/3-demethylubiquinone-9 3-methyltransferase
MLRPAFVESWPESFRLSYSYDDLELWGNRENLGYTYQYQNRRRWALNTIEELLPRGSSILDVAAASGNFALPLAEKGYRVTWNDLRSELADFVKLKYESGQIEFLPGNIFELSNKLGARFDSVVAFEVIEHVAHPDQFLASVAKLITPGGRLFLTTPNGRYFRFNLPRFSDCPDPTVYESVQYKPNADGHIFLLDTAEIRDLSKSVGLEIERLELMTNPLTNGHMKLGLLLPYLPSSLVSFAESMTRKLPRSFQEKLSCQMAAVLRKPAS